MNITTVYHSALGIRKVKDSYTTSLIKSEKATFKQKQEIKSFDNKDEFVSYLSELVETEQVKLVILKSGRNIDELKDLLKIISLIPVGTYGLTEIVASDLTAIELADLDFANRKLIKIKDVKAEIKEEVKSKPKKKKSKK